MQTGEPLNELALFAGAGGGILGGHLLGWRTVCAVEWDAYAASVLVARQNDGCLPPFPVWDDVQTFDGTAWRGRVDVVSGGFPCQDISAAGKGAGIDGERSGMWAHMARIIGEIRPRFAFVENSPMLTLRGLDRVLGDLSSLGYDAEWGTVGAEHAIAYSGTRCADHERIRIWILAEMANTTGGQPRQQAEWKGRQDFGRGSEEIYALAYPNRLRESQPQGTERNERRWTGDACEAVSDTECERRGQVVASIAGGTHSERPASETQHRSRTAGGAWWESEPDVGRVAHGVASRVDRLRCLGNGQVPHAMVLAWITLCGRTEK
jgi:DNA (cytosine-5)-methyltransferase 1